MAERAALHPARAPHPPHPGHGQPLDPGPPGHPRHRGQGGALHSAVILSHTLALQVIVTLSVINIYLVNIFYLPVFSNIVSYQVCLTLG